jgi:hypothetical protein
MTVPWCNNAELMLLGFISLLLTVFQGMIQKTCISSGWTLHMLPCKREELEGEESGPAKEHFVTSQIIGRIGRRLLSDGAAGVEICKHKVIAPSLLLTLSVFLGGTYRTSRVGYSCGPVQLGTIVTSEHANT